MISIPATPPRFDWYSSSFEPSGQVADVFAPLVDESPRPCRPRMGFERAFELRRNGCTVGRVMSGSRHEWAYVEASGEDAPALAEHLRGAGIPHSVARVDACADVVSETAYDSFEHVLMSTLPLNVTRTRFEQTRNGQIASTLYLGSRKSESFARLYEKGKESPETYAAGTVRMEVQARPKGTERKAWAATATPHEVMSIPGWSGTLLSLVDLDRLPPPPRSKRVSDLEGALEAMGSQYGRRVRELLALHGGDLDATWGDLQQVFGLA